MLTIWGRATSTNVQKVLWACDELGSPTSASILAEPLAEPTIHLIEPKNPNGLIPTLEDDDFVLWESNASCGIWTAGDAQCRLLPADLNRRERANIDRWLDWQLVSLGLALRALFILLHRAGKLASEAEITAATKNASAMFWILDAHLATQRYAGGDRFTLADIPIGISAHRWFSLGVQRPVMPALETWYERISGRQGFRNVRAIPLR